MEIKLIEPYGYCYGVDRAINIALDAKKDNPNREVCVLGMLVHNEDAIETLNKAGIRTIYHNDKQIFELINLVPQNAVVILTAHGHSKAVEAKLNEKGISFIDATCPFVNKINSSLESYIRDGFDVLYVGKKGHTESEASCSISNKIHLIDFSNPVIPEIESKKIVLVSQSTFSHEDIKPIFKMVKQKYDIVIYVDEICNASSSRQKALCSLDKVYDLVYVVGGKNSNNTATLLRLAKEKYPSSKVFQITNAKDIDSCDLNNVNSVAISSGASTPKEIVFQIIDKIKLLCN